MVTTTLGSAGVMILSAASSNTVLTSYFSSVTFYKRNIKNVAMRGNVMEYCHGTNILHTARIRMSMSGICATRGNVMEYFKPGV